MEGVHGVDVSWLHHANKDHAKLKQTTQKVTASPQPTQGTLHPPSKPLQTLPENSVNAVTSTSPPEALPQMPGASTPKGIRRPSLRSKSSKEKLLGTPTRGDEAKSSGRKPSWITNIGSKFSSLSKDSTPSAVPDSPRFNDPKLAPAKYTPPATPTKEIKTNPLATSGQNEAVAGTEEKVEPYTPPTKEKSSFFGALRRLSSSTGTAGGVKAASSGYVCPRKVLNIDSERDRSRVKELDQSKLRRVAFSVDVEVAGVSRYIDEQEPTDPLKKTVDKKLKERGEGEALRNPQLLKDATENESRLGTGERRRRRSSQSVDDILENEMLAAAKESAKAEAFKQRQEENARRQKEAEDFGKVPKETNATATEAPNDATTKDSEPSPAQPNGDASGSRPQDRPTTDPLRMYRRCCQLREAPVLKRISEQLGALKNKPTATPGTVDCLDLNGSRLQLPDLVCLGDWLAIVPVKTLLMDNANLSDEGLRVVLAGLLAAKPSGLNKRKRGRSSPTKLRSNSIQRSPGVVEKLSLRGNVKLTKVGWTHLCLFIHMSRSIKCIDLTVTPFPKCADSASLKPNNACTTPQKPSLATSELLFRSISERFAGDTLEELILSDCGLSSEDLCRIVDAASISGIKRLGLAKSQLDAKAMEAIATYIRSGKCVGLDIGGCDLHETISTLAEAMQSECLVHALGLADCHLDSESLRRLLVGCVSLPDLRFLDISHNHGLFEDEKSSIGSLRKYLPQCLWLRRLHMIDVNMTPAQAIGIIDFLPEVRNLNHFSILENERLKALANATETDAQEDACAFYASMMVAVRISKTLICVEMDPPGPESTQVVKALAKQTLAYSLRNLERWTKHDAMKAKDPASVIPDLEESGFDVEMAEVLGHLIGYPGEPAANHKDEELGPNQDYLVGGTGVAKALSYVLGQKAADLRRMSTVFAGNGIDADSQAGKAKARAMSKNLLISARKIREKLQPAIAREALVGNEMDHKRLQFLEHTLQGMIERFEEEFPECRVESPTDHTQSTSPTFFPLSHSLPETQEDSEPVERPLSPHTSRLSSDSEKSTQAESTGSNITDPDSARDSFDPTLFDFRSSVFGSVASRRASVTSMAARAQNIEEGRIHKLGQRMRRDVLPPKGQDDHLHRTSVADAPEPPYIRALRNQLEAVSGEELKEKVLQNGIDATVKEYMDKAEDLKDSEGVWPVSPVQNAHEKNKVILEVMSKAEKQSST